MILVTGGLGYLGSHTCVALQRAGLSLLVVDNLANSRIAVLERMRALGGGEVEFVQADVRDRAALDAAMRGRRIEAVMHFAGLKAVGESVARPLEYYDNNLTGTLVLLQAMAAAGVHALVFSSSATVYGEPAFLPYTEEHPLNPVSPYAVTKRGVERLLEDLAAADARFRYAALRYFNPIGAHPSGRIGEDPRGIPGNLFPYLTQVAVGRLDQLTVHGRDYDTPDGTGVRDYIHVMDLADGHLAALRHLLEARGSITANLGTGRGTSVLELIAAFERVTGLRVPHVFGPRRDGDIASYYADARLAERALGWRASRGIEDMCRDAWAWQSANPSGYPD